MKQRWKKETLVEANRFKHTKQQQDIGKFSGNEGNQDGYNEESKKRHCQR